MATVDQLLRQLARRSGDVSYWVLAHVEWDRLLRPFVPQCPAAQQVLDELPPLVFGIWSRSDEAAP